MKFPEKVVKIEGMDFNTNYVDYCDIPDWYIIFDQRELKKFIKDLKINKKDINKALVCTIPNESPKTFNDYKKFISKFLTELEGGKKD